MIAKEINKAIDELLNDVKPLNNHQAKMINKIRKIKPVINTIGVVAEMQHKEKDREVKFRNYKKSNEYEIKKARILKAYGL